MNKTLLVTTQDGNQHEIKVIDVFVVDEFPDKEYIAYTFGEETENSMIKSYISILTENDDDIKIEAIADKSEWDIVQQNFQNMLSNNEEGNGEVNEQ